MCLKLKLGTDFMYKIMDTKSGLFSRGGSVLEGIKWSKVGKTWDHGGLMNHLTQFIIPSHNGVGGWKTEKLVIPESWQIICFKLNVSQCDHFNALSHFKEKSKIYAEKVGKGVLK